MTTYFVEYQCSKQQNRYNGYLEFDNRRFPSERTVRRLIADQINQNRVQNLSWIVVGKLEAKND